MSVLLFIFSVLFGYLLGSLCSAIIVSRMFSLPDPRLEGSKNPGATNVLRLAGKKYALIVLLFDALKGVIPVLLAKALGASPTTVAFTCLAAVAGHMFPVFFQYRGGKGVATAIGAFLALHFILGVTIIATWLIVANFTRYSSLGSIVSMCLAPFYSMLMLSNINTFPPLFFIAIFILYKHRNNITRLIDGTEPKIIFKSNVLAKLTASAREAKPEIEKSIQTTPKDQEKKEERTKRKKAKKKQEKPD
ncbi:glycerol-3-phosphate 1-O-acyltransferase PlsY [Legionella israelensis]|uniref:glycerol-3-phosphate 1-O-acyltransferase PlsY n=1 Tax=Legionella israelensis TaxID=454 RepID=UPI00117EA851|nr:glycerol-3-phosphate 1-O-acyltransferase PlsY [Legionella israelensis]QDP72222.1 glycerol-3-phosphate 1-O-acyltransferase PlsY [Legionella israelensis]